MLQGGLALAGLGLVVGCERLMPRAQLATRAARIGLLSPYAPDPSPEGTAFRQGLRGFGWIDGQNAVIEGRHGASAEAVRASAKDLVDRGVDVIVTVGSDATRAAREATDTVPIVMLQSTSPLGEGLVASLARPGGNVTGLTNLGAGLSAKRLELFKAAVPGLSRVAVLWYAASSDANPDVHEIQSAARTLGVEVMPMPFQGYGAFVDTAFETMVRSGADGVVLLLDQTTSLIWTPRIATVAMTHRLPTISETRAFPDQGGLLAYGPNLPDLYQRGAFYVDRILRGAKPGDLPVEQPTTFDFVVNMKTAEAIGLTIPHAVLQQATELIQ
jgi:putative ABC transport system substrate-binding protein